MIPFLYKKSQFICNYLIMMYILSTFPFYLHATWILNTVTYEISYFIWVKFREFKVRFNESNDPFKWVK